MGRAIASHKYFDMSREQIRNELEIPSRFFLGRGFSREILDAFDVGDSRKLRRVVVPLYDDEGRLSLGYTVRSYEPRCDRCAKHHGPAVSCKWGQGKWGISQGFLKRVYMYNYAAVAQT